MNMLQNNVSGPPLMIPVKEGLNGDKSWWDKGWRWLWMILLAVGVIACTAYLFGPKKSAAQIARQELEQFFLSEGYDDLETSHDFSIIMGTSHQNDPYGGCMGANVSEEWYFDGYSEDGESSRPVWSGFYNNALDAYRVASGISEDGTQLHARIGGKYVEASLDKNPNCRIYYSENTILYYDGGNPEVYALLEKLCGKPIADGGK